MAETYAPALVRIGDIVESFMVKWRVPMNDFTNMLLFAFDCYRDNMSHTSRLYNRKIVTADANGTITMPEDMIDFIGLYPATEKTLWPSTENTNLNPEAVSANSDIAGGYESVGYAGRGAVNEYYHKIAWAERKIYTDGFEGQDVLLMYVSTGIRTDEETYIDVTLAPVIDAYLYWRLGELNGAPINELERRERGFEKAIRLASRYKLPPLRSVWDSLLSVTSQGLRR
jgi:hypothetical protein